MSDIVRLPGGKIITRSRAQALGMLDANGDLKPGMAPDSAGARIIEQDRKAAAWAKQQGLPAPVSRRSGEDVATTADGRIKPVAKIEPLKPANVDPSGAAITDEATLAAIAAETAAIEAAKVAATGPTPAEKRLATMAANKAAREAAEAEALQIEADAAAALVAATSSETPVNEDGTTALTTEAEDAEAAEAAEATETVEEPGD